MCNISNYRIELVKFELQINQITPLNFRMEVSVELQIANSNTNQSSYELSNYGFILLTFTVLLIGSFRMKE